MKIAKLTAVLWVFACLSPAKASEDKLYIEETGFGPLQIGMTKAALEALGKKVDYHIPNGDQVGIDCTNASVEGINPSLILENGGLARIYFFKPDYATRSGIKVGDSEKKVRATYGKALKVEPHAYNEGFYLFKLNKQGVGLLFETDRGIISSISVGRRPTIEYMEGCL